MFNSPETSETISMTAFISMIVQAAPSRSRLWRPAVGCLSLVSLALACLTSAAADPVHLDDNPAAAADSLQKKYPELLEAQKKFQQQDFDGALEILKTAANAHAELSNPRVILATLFFATNRLPAGRAALEKAVLEMPDDPEPYLLFGELALRESQVTDAGLLFDKAAPLAAAFKGDPERTKKLQIRAEAGQAAVAEMREQWETAQKHLQAWLKLDPKSAIAQFRLGRALFGTDQRAAYTALQAAAKLDSKVPSPEVTMAKLFQQKKDKDSAEKWMKSAVGQAPKDLKVRVEVGQWLWENGRFAEAKKEADEALKLDSTSVDALLLAGLVARFSKDYAGATQFLEKASLLSPGNQLVASQLALALIEQADEGKKQRALKLAESNMQQNQKSSDAAATLGWIYYRLGRLDDAERFLNGAAQAGNISLDTAYFLAKLSADRGKLDQAKALLQSALKGTGPFAYRPEAKTWFNQLEGKPITEGKSAPQPKSQSADAKK
jgi:Tfp pilus assembly protein PilF